MLLAAGSVCSGGRKRKDTAEHLLDQTMVRMFDNTGQLGSFRITRHDHHEGVLRIRFKLG